MVIAVREHSETTKGSWSRVAVSVKLPVGLGEKTATALWGSTPQLLPNHLGFFDVFIIVSVYLCCSEQSLQQNLEAGGSAEAEWAETVRFRSFHQNNILVLSLISQWNIKYIS